MNLKTLCLLQEDGIFDKSMWYFCSSSMMELAVLASRPVVGSSRNRREGEVMSSIPMLHLFFSPPETPRKNIVPIWEKTSPYKVPSVWKDTYCNYHHTVYTDIAPNPIVVVLEIVFVWLKRMTLTQFFHTLKDDVLFIPTKQINFDIPLQEAEVYYLSVCAIFEAELLDDGLHPHLSVRWGILLSWQTKIGRECQVLPYGQSTHQNVILKDKQKEMMYDFTTLAYNYLAINIQNMLCKIQHYTHLRSKVCVQ